MTPTEQDNYGLRERYDTGAAGDKCVCREYGDFRRFSPAGVVVEGSHDCIWGKASPREVA